MVGSLFALQSAATVPCGHRAEVLTLELVSVTIDGVPAVENDRFEWSIDGGVPVVLDPTTTLYGERPMYFTPPSPPDCRSDLVTGTIELIPPGLREEVIVGLTVTR